MNKRFASRYQFQVDYLLSFDKSDDDNERDPFTFRYADVNNFEPVYYWSTAINAAILMHLRHFFFRMT